MQICSRCNLKIRLGGIHTKRCNATLQKSQNCGTGAIGIGQTFRLRVYRSKGFCCPYWQGQTTQLGVSHQSYVIHQRQLSPFCPLSFMYGNRYKTLKKIFSFLYIDGITEFLLKGRVTERTKQKQSNERRTKKCPN